MAHLDGMRDVIFSLTFATSRNYDAFESSWFLVAPVRETLCELTCTGGENVAGSCIAGGIVL